MAGFSFLTVYSLTSFDSDAEFLYNYQSTSNESRRFIYILATVSLAGAIDASLDIVAPSSTDAMSIVNSSVGSELISGGRQHGKNDESRNARNEDDKTYASTADRYTMSFFCLFFIYPL